MSAPEVSFATLPQSDGSVSYIWQGYSILASVNGPIEPQRRDELPEEAFLEVNLKQASGGGAPRDRHTETLLHSTLRDIILTTAHPATLIQLTLQVLSTPPLSSSASTVGPPLQSDSILPALPHLINASVFALLDGNIPLRKVCAAVGVEAISSETGQRNVVLGSSGEPAESVHVFAFSSKTEMLLAQSEGECDVETWQECAKVAEEACLGSGGQQEGGLIDSLRGVIGGEVEAKTRWRKNL